MRPVDRLIWIPLNKACYSDLSVFGGCPKCHKMTRGDTHFLFIKMGKRGIMRFNAAQFISAIGASKINKINKNKPNNPNKKSDDSAIA